MQWGMLTLELSAIVLEIPNDAYTTLSQNLIGCSTLSQNEKATLNIKMPYCVSVTNINTNLAVASHCWAINFILTLLYCIFSVIDMYFSFSPMSVL